MKRFLGGFVGLILVYVFAMHQIAPHLKDSHSINVAWGQTGPTGPTGPTGAAGSVTYNNHTLFGGSAPTITECGKNSSLGAGSNDNAGTIIVSATPTVSPVTVCTITFAVAFTHAPAMSFTTSKNQILASPLSISTTGTRFRLSADMTGGVITYSAF